MKNWKWCWMLGALLLVPALAQSTNYTLDFSAPYPEPYPAGGIQLHTQSFPGTGVTAYFGGVWRRGWDCDQPGGNKCHPCTGQGHYEPIPNGGSPGRQREDDSGDFANEPSPGAVAWLPSGWPESNGGDPDSVQIVFNQDVKLVSFWYSSSVNYTYWCYSPDSCGYGAECSVNGPLKPNPVPRLAKFLSASQLVVGQVVMDQPGTRDETGCSGDPLGSACKWTKVEFSSAQGIRKIRFETGALGPFFMDDLTVSTDATIPSQAHSDLSGGVILVGTDAQHQPAVSYAPTIRDASDNPLSGIPVTLSLDPLGCHVTVCGDNYNSDAHTVTASTGVDGVAEFHLSGMRDDANPPPATVTVAGVQWATKPVSAMDLDRSGEQNGIAITGGDLSLFLADFYGGSYHSRSDYNGNGIKDGDDLSQFLDHFLSDPVGGCVIYSGKPCGPQPAQSAAAVPLVDRGWARDGYYDLAGRRLDRPPARGLYWEVKHGQPRKIAVVK